MIFLGQSQLFLCFGGCCFDFGDVVLDFKSGFGVEGDEGFSCSYVDGGGGAVDFAGNDFPAVAFAALVGGDDDGEEADESGGVKSIEPSYGLGAVKVPDWFESLDE